MNDIPKGYKSVEEYKATLKINLRLLKQPEYLPNASKEWREGQIKRYKSLIANCN